VEQKCRIRMMDTAGVAGKTETADA
jgi:hypothetical protein